ncbi:MAG: hypothetical protein CTY18_02980 [Methylomonas sp.]|nr:MAG: hypothetical protein CTY18_02980 [Methylomonas sp.]
MNGYLKSSEVVVFLGLHKHIFYNGVSEVSDFPTPVKQSGAHWFSRQDIEQWAATHDAKKVFGVAAYAKHAARKSASDNAPRFANQMARDMITGKFLPPAAQRERSLKKLVAKCAGKKTERVRTPDVWGD